VPEGWEGEVFSWLWEHKQGELGYAAEEGD
jgi:hypothetical protein